MVKMLSSPWGLVKFFLAPFFPTFSSLFASLTAFSRLLSSLCLSAQPAFFTNWIVSTRTVGTTSEIKHIAFFRIDFDI